MLYILTLAFCALLCIGAVFLFSSGANAAFAAETQDGVTIELQHGNAIYSYINDKIGNTSCYTSTVAYSRFNTTGTTTTKENGAAYSKGNSSKDYYFKGVYEDFSYKVTIPARKYYAIRFKFYHYSSKNQTNGSSSSRTASEMFRFGREDKSSELSFSVANYYSHSPGNSSSYTFGRVQTTSNSSSSTSGYSTVVVNFDNSGSSTATEFTEYFGFFAYAGGAANIHTRLAADWNLNSWEVLTNPIKVPTINATFKNVVDRSYKYETEYNGENQTFNLLNYEENYMIPI